MSARHYRFEHTAYVEARPDEVAGILLDLEHYPRWWPQIRAVASLGPDDALVVCRATLPYDLELKVHAVSRTTTRPEVEIDGPFRGFARWELTPTGAGTAMAFTQQVEVVSIPLVVASHLARRLLVWNHEAMMRGCIAGLRQALAPHQRR